LILEVEAVCEDFSTFFGRRLAFKLLVVVVFLGLLVFAVVLKAEGVAEKLVLRVTVIGFSRRLIAIFLPIIVPQSRRILILTKILGNKVFIGKLSPFKCFLNGRTLQKLPIWALIVFYQVGVVITL